MESEGSVDMLTLGLEAEDRLGVDMLTVGLLMVCNAKIAIYLSENPKKRNADVSQRSISVSYIQRTAAESLS